MKIRRKKPQHNYSEYNAKVQKAACLSFSNYFYFAFYQKTHYFCIQTKYISGIHALIRET